MGKATQGKVVTMYGCLKAATRTPGSDVASVTGFERIFDVSALAAEVEKSKVDYVSMDCATFGQIIATKSRVIGKTITMTVNSATAKVIAAHLSGSQTAMTGAGGTVTGEAVVMDTEPGVYSKFDNRNVSAVSSTTPVGVDGTDFTVDYDLGMVTIIAGGTLAAGGSVDFNYTYAAETGLKQAVGDVPTIEWAIEGVLTNSYDESADPYLVVIPACTIDAANEHGLIVDFDAESTEYQFTITPRKLSGEDLDMYIAQIQDN